MTPPITRHGVTAVAHLPAGDYTLKVKAANVTLDKEWLPYAQVSLVCARPPESVLEELDPRLEDVRVTVTLTRNAGPYVGDLGSGLEHLWETEQTRVFSLILVGRTAATTDRTVIIRCDSDEALAIGDALLETTPDDQFFSLQDSLRDIVNAVLVRYGTELYNPGGPPFDPGNSEGDADASVWYYADETNLVTNPSGETGATTGWTASACTVGASASAVTNKVGANVFKLSSPSSSLSYIRTEAITVVPGETYVASAMYTTNVVQSGTIDSRARRIQIVNTADNASLAQSPQGNAPVSVNMTRLEVEVTIPAGVTSIWVRLWHGATAGTVYFDAIKFAKKTEVFDPYEYFDGTTTDTDIYTYAWTGTAHASTSTRVAADGVSPDRDSYIWEPGQTAWDFLEPLVQASGLRLYCTEAGDWRLVDQAAVPAGSLVVAKDANLIEAAETISRYADWYDGVVVCYRWSTAAGVSKVKYDVASNVVGTPKSVLTINLNSPYPGRGYAAAVLARSEGRGRVFALDALSDLATTPGDSISATIPDTPDQNGRVTGVTWELPGRRMTVRSSGLVDVVETAWIELAEGESWLESLVGDSWLEETA